ncbi:putative trans-sialidase, Group V [Trypanosoma cruzi]|uniref:Putative trans-sialidase, Group V n=1 Tax=Trypanosoma cruzi TaxID=5693 RepID=A0A2V2VCG1_TRYCR|nr:putative trans-sialidase, Group V [Trypanosoma cruzi]
MPSRAAAVKAPRTHNRRRVTGSSGRRREGGESEPQKPNMSRHLFYSAVLLLVVMVGCGSCAAGVAGQSDETKFQWKGINGGGGETVESLGAPSLLKVGSDVFAVAEAQCKKDGDVSFTGVASQLLTTKTADTPVELFSDALTKTQLLEEGASDDEKKKLDVSRPTTAVRGSDIYMLAGEYDSKDCPSSGADGCGLLLIKGSVNTEGTSNKKIDWKVIETPPESVDARLGSWTRLIGSGGSGVKMKDETLVFPVEGTKKAAVGGEDVKTVSLIIYSSDNTKLKLSKGMPDGGCSVPSVVEWKDDKLMMMTACDDGRRRVYESGDMGESWTEALGTLSRVWGNKKKGEEAKAVGSGFITATVGNDGDNRNVMLVTLPVYAEKVENKKGKLHLWLTDNTHTVDIGPVSREDDDAAASSLLYNSGENTDGKKDDELIALYAKKKDGEKPSPGMVSVLLTEQLKRVKEVLTTWKEVDGRVSNLCTSLIAEKDPSTGDVCSAVKITAGLVGFLSGKFSGNVWRDEYLGVNATVNNKESATNTFDGVTFTGRGAGAEWPVGKQGQNQLYHFANYNFTLVATVSIDKVPEGNTPIPLIGVRAGSNGNENNVLLGLSYNSGKKWHVLCGDGKTDEVSSTWETGTPQHVVILLKNGTQCSVYVDGQRVGNGECALGNGESKEISHFYIGGDGENKESREEGVSVTVANVLLYNRPWDEAEITALNPNKAPTPSPVNEPSQETAIETSTGQGKAEPRQSMGSSKGAGSGGSTADGDPTVETREGGTDGQKGEIHAQKGDVKAAALSSSLGNVSQGNDSDAGSVCGSGLLPLLLLLLLGLWGSRLCDE